MFMLKNNLKYIISIEKLSASKRNKLGIIGVALINGGRQSVKNQNI